MAAGLQERATTSYDDAPRRETTHERVGGGCDCPVLGGAPSMTSEEYDY